MTHHKTRRLRRIAAHETVIAGSEVQIKGFGGMRFVFPFGPGAMRTMLDAFSAGRSIEAFVPARQVTKIRPW
jgi:hypothetical protein